MANSVGKLKSLLKRFLPDKDAINFGEGKNTLQWKIWRRRIVIEMRQKYEGPVTVFVICGVTGDLAKFKKPPGIDARFISVKID